MGCMQSGPSGPIRDWKEVIKTGGVAIEITDAVSDADATVIAEALQEKVIIELSLI